MCVYMYVRHDKKIAKLFFSVRSTQFPFKLNILFKKYISTSWAPKHSIDYLKRLETQSMHYILHYISRFKFLKYIFSINKLTEKEIDKDSE